MIIAKYIRQLLEEGKRVIFPGFGNLEVKDSSGVASQTAGRIEPPGMTLRFDAGYSKDDGLLASALALGEGLPDEEAAQQVLELIDAIKFALDKGETFDIPGTGTFSRNEDGKVLFLKDKDWLLEPDQYGLESMELLELEELPEEEEISEGGTGSGLDSEPAAVTASKPAPVSQTEGAATQQPAGKGGEKRARGRKVIWLIAGVLAVVLVAVILIPREGPENQTEPPVSPAEEVQKDAPATEQAGEGEQQAGPEATDMLDEVQTKQVQKPVKTEHHYYIIAGSFKKLGYASDLQDQLKARGYPAEVMITGDRMYRVSVLSFATQQEALRKLAEIKSEPGLSSCWLLAN